MYPTLPSRFSPLTPILVAACVSAGLFTSLAETAPPSLLSGSATNATTGSGPRIQFSELVFDFGKMDSGTLVKHDYIFTNTGDQTLIVTNVQPSCGCTTAGTWDKVVEPGKTGIIPVQFNSAGYGGAVLKTITVTCNDPTNRNVTLQLKGTAWKAIDLLPQWAMFSLLPDLQTNQTQIVRIVNNADDPVTVFDPAFSNSAFRTEFKTVREGKEFELKVTLVPPLTNAASTPITLKTSSLKIPVLTVTAYAAVQPLLTVTPPQITLPPGPLASASKPTVTIQNNSTNALVLSEPSLTAEGADIEIKEGRPGRVFTLALSFPAGFQIQPGHPVEASVKSDSPKFPLIKVPIYQLPPPAAPAPTAAPAAYSGPPKAAAATSAAVSTAGISAAAQSVGASVLPSPAPK